MSSALRGLDEDTEVTDEARKQCSLWWEEIEGRLVFWEAKLFQESGNMQIA